MTTVNPEKAILEPQPLNPETIIEICQAIEDSDSFQEIEEHTRPVREYLSAASQDEVRQTVARLFSERQVARVAFQEGILNQASAIYEAPDDMWQQEKIWLQPSSNTPLDGAADFRNEVGKRIRPKAAEIQALLDPRSPEYKKLNAINTAIGLTVSYLEPESTK